MISQTPVAFIYNAHPPTVLALGNLAAALQFFFGISGFIREEVVSCSVGMNEQREERIKR